MTKIWAFAAALLLSIGCSFAQPVGSFPQGGGGGSPPAGNDCGGSGTIAFDAAAPASANWNTSTSTFSWSHTVTGSNPILLVYVIVYGGAQTVSGITYNGVALTKIDSVAGAVESTTQDTEDWYLINPATGAHTVAVTLSGSASFTNGTSSSYTGVNQTTPINAHSAAVNNSSTTNQSGTATATGGGHCWEAGAVFTRGGNPNALTPGTIRIGGGNIQDSLTSGDSNGQISVGSQSLAWSNSSSITWPGVLTIVLAPIP